MLSLVSSWLNAESALGRSQAEAIRRLNHKLGARFTASRVSEWRDGRRTPSAEVVRYMLSYAIPYAIRWIEPKLLTHISDPVEFTSRMIQACSIPVRKPRQKTGQDVEE